MLRDCLMCGMRLGVWVAVVVWVVGFAAAAGWGQGSAGGGVVSYGPELQGFAYPYPVGEFAFTSQRQAMHMAYMDVRPKAANGRTVVLLHGKNFCAATWKQTIDVLVEWGYRVVAPDQIGFCRGTRTRCWRRWGWGG